MHPSALVLVVGCCTILLGKFIESTLKELKHIRLFTKTNSQNEDGENKAEEKSLNSADKLGDGEPDLPGSVPDHCMDLRSRLN